MSDNNTNEHPQLNSLRSFSDARDYYRFNILTGEIISLYGRSPRVITSWTDPDGYVRIWIQTTDGRSRSIHQAHLVAEMHGMPRPTPDHTINHKNGDRSDNQYPNLEWVLQIDNLPSSGKCLRLSLDQVAAAQAKRDYGFLGMSDQKLAKVWGVPARTVSNAGKGKTYAQRERFRLEDHGGIFMDWPTGRITITPKTQAPSFNRKPTTAADLMELGWYVLPQEAEQAAPLWDNPTPEQFQQLEEIVKRWNDRQAGRVPIG